MWDGKLILWRSLKNEWEVNGRKYHFQFLEQYSNIDSLEFNFLKICRFFNMAEKLSMSNGRDRKLELYLKYLVLGNEINKK